jgi:hypothetical protein
MHFKLMSGCPPLITVLRSQLGQSAQRVEHTCSASRQDQMQKPLEVRKTTPMMIVWAPLITVLSASYSPARLQYLGGELSHHWAALWSSRATVAHSVAENQNCPCFLQYLYEGSTAHYHSLNGLST